jgi:hypothetical protein
MPQIHNPLLFYGAATALVAYLLYTMIRRRRPDRPGAPNHEPDL